MSSVRGCEAPIRLGVIFVAILFPGGDLVGKDLLVGYAAVETLGRQGRRAPTRPELVATGRAAWFHRDRQPRLGDELL